VGLVQAARVVVLHSPILVTDFIKLEETECLFLLTTLYEVVWHGAVQIHLITTEKEFKSIVITALVNEGWGPGLKDTE